MTRQAIVVGAGLAGLTAAHQLQRAGWTVQVLEAQDKPGGRMGTRHSGPITYNTGARLIYPFGKTLHALIDEVGLRSAMVPIHGLSATCQHVSGDHEVELLPSLRSLGTPGLSWPDRLKLVTAALGLLATRWRTDPDLAMSALWTDSVSLSEHIRRTAGENVLQRMVEPVFRGTRSWNPEGISAAFYASTMPHLIGARSVYSLKGGMGQLTERLALDLDLRCRAQVEQIERLSGEGCVVRWREGELPFERKVDVVVCATEGARAQALLASLRPAEEVLFAHVRYNSLGVLHLALEGDLPPQLLFSARMTPTRIATWQQSSRTAERPAMLYCQLTPEAVTEAQDQEMSHRLRDFLIDEIRMRIPDVESRIVHEVNQWIACKLPVFSPGYGQVVKTFLANQTASRQQVYFCGDYLAQALLNGACRSGSDVAATLLRHWA